MGFVDDIPRVKGCQNGYGPLGTSTMTCRSARPLEWAAPLQRSLAGAPPRYATDAQVRRLRTTKPSPTAPIIGNVIIILIMIIILRMLTHVTCHVSFV